MPLTWTRTIPALLVAAAFALALPIELPEEDAAVSNEACLTLAEREPRVALPPASTLEQCIALYPSDVELLADLAETYEAADPARAESLLKRAVDLDPSDGNLRLRLGNLLLARGAADEAYAQAVTGLTVQPNRSELIELGRAARQSGSRGAE